MLVTLNEVMRIAEENKIAIGSFNTPNLESIQAVLGAAEELDLPVIIQFAQCHEENMELKVIGPVMVDMAKRAKVPVCVHLDHGETLDYLARALELGFTSIMYDGSALSFEENVENTKKAIAMAKDTGASVEAELGSMGKRESGSGDTEGGDDTKIYTDPELAKRFVEETGIDALACSFGTTHGIYLTAPMLDFTVVERVRKECGNIPVVMHGGSGVSVQDFRKAILAGVRKVNYFTYMDKAGGSAVAEAVKGIQEGKVLFFMELSHAAMLEMKENVKEAMKIFAGM